MKFRIFLFALVATFLFACGGNDIDCEDTTVVENAVTSAFQNINSAINTWNDSEKLDANCEILKSAYEDFIDVLEDVNDCGVDSTTDIQEAQNSLAGLPCS